MEVLYYDNHVLVVKKAPGIPTQSEEGISVEKEARSWVKAHFKKQGEAFVHALHRLDKPVSGIVLLAKTSKALERLHASFRNKCMKKTYVALVEGDFDPDLCRLEDFLVQVEFRAKKAHEGDPGAKLCALNVRVIKRLGFATLVEVDLETGRYHQIRVQLSSRGYPIVGDLKYGAKYVCAQRGHIALHHQKMRFPHPISKEEISFETPPPKLWESWIKELSIFYT